MHKKILAMLVITLIATAFCGIMVSGDIKVVVNGA